MKTEQAPKCPRCGGYKLTDIQAPTERHMFCEDCQMYVLVERRTGERRVGERRIDDLEAARRLVAARLNGVSDWRKRDRRSRDRRKDANGR